MLKVTTNNNPRQMLYGCDLPEDVKKDFDYLGDDLAFADIVKYKGAYYDLGEFLTGAPEGWDGISSQSAFHAVVVKIVDSDHVIVGTIYS